MTSAPLKALHPTEFIALIAMLFATIAFSIDSMLPALPEIASELTPSDPNKAQLIITSFVLGMGIGTLFAGPLSDSFGRKPVIIAGSALYCVAALAACFAPSLETVLLARVVQGLGAAGPRVVTLALVRDMHKGREMARVMSFAMMIFTLVPAVAPLLGSYIIAYGGWRSIFVAFLVFSAISMAWITLRQPETMPANLRRPLALRPLWDALREVMTNRVIVLSILVQTLCFACLFGTLSATQPVFDVTFGKADSFPFWFAVIALVSGLSSIVNATLVGRLGMRRLVTVSLGGQMVLSAFLAIVTSQGLLPPSLAFAGYMVWTISVFFMIGMTIGNMNAIAMEPVGHIAGMAASVIGAVSTVLAVLLAVPVGLSFDGTPVPLMLGVGVFSATGFAIMLKMGR